MLGVFIYPHIPLQHKKPGVKNSGLIKKSYGTFDIFSLIPNELSVHGSQELHIVISLLHTFLYKLHCFE